MSLRIDCYCNLYTGLLLCCEVGSMETQIALVQDFINRSGELNYVDTYFDNRSQNFLFSPLAEMASEAKM